MAAKKFLRNVAGFINEVFGIQMSAGVANAGDIPALNNSGYLDSTIVNSVTSSAGAGDTGKLPALNGTGQLDQTFMPTGIVPETAIINTSESLADGDWVNVFDAGSSVFKVRKADATTFGKHAHGFVLAAFTHPTAATVYFEGSNTHVTAQTPGDVFLTTTAGIGSATPPSASGNVQQVLGIAVSATKVKFTPAEPIVLA